ncbi:MAG: hypothetical protein IJT83_06065, partial [Victivallales bacterium]|nr:hypothetical protein [Victivallales bacterium]
MSCAATRHVVRGYAPRTQDAEFGGVEMHGTLLPALRTRDSVAWRCTGLCSPHSGRGMRWRGDARDSAPRTQDAGCGGVEMHGTLLPALRTRDAVAWRCTGL